MTTTPNFNLPKPVDTADVDEEFYRLQQAWDLLDLILLSLTTQIAGKANLGHGHAISDIVGLLAALANKMDASRTFSLDDLTDVDGAASAALNYVLVKGADGKWMPSSAIAALGPHQHSQEDVVGLVTALTALSAAIAARLPLAGGTMTGDIDLAGHALQNAGDGTADYLKGLMTTRVSATQVSVATGSIKGNGRFVKNAATLAKNINATWVAGNNVGGMESGFAVAANLTYHLHALRKISDGSFEWIYSPNTTLTTIPTGYEWVGRFWAVYTNASSQIVDYTQVGNVCYTAQVQWFTTTSTLSFAIGTLPATVPLPGGIRVRAFVFLNIQVVNVSCSMAVSDGDDTAGTASSGAAGQASNTAGASNGSFRGTAISSTARQLGRLVSGTSAGSSVNIGGWEDYTLPRVY